MVSIGGDYRKETDRSDYNDILETQTKMKIEYERKALTFGVGAILPFNSSRTAIFNPIVGVSLGKMNSDLYNINTVVDNRFFFFKGNSRKYYFKPYFNLNVLKSLKASFVPQFSFVKHTNVQTNYPEDKAEDFIH